MVAFLYRARYSSRLSARLGQEVPPLTDDQIKPGERFKRAVFAAAAYQGIKGSEPAIVRATGVARNTLRRLFAGQSPDGQTLEKIAAGLNTTPGRLLAAREGRSTGGLEQIALEIQWLREALVPGLLDDVVEAGDVEGSRRLRSRARSGPPRPARQPGRRPLADGAERG